MVAVNNHANGINGAVAAELRAERAALGLTQEQVSNLSGVPLVTVQRLLAAKRAIDVEQLDKLARALGTTAEQVMVNAVARLSRGSD